MRLNKALERTFNAATLRIHFTSSPVLPLNSKDRLPVHNSSMVVYSFVCGCSANYVGRTTRHLSTRIREHTPAWLGMGLQKSITSAIVGHLIDCNHPVNRDQSFTVIYRVPRNRSRLIRKQILSVAEAIAIRIFTPTLCGQKNFVRSLQLPWPRVVGSSFAEHSSNVQSHNSVIGSNIT